MNGVEQPTRNMYAGFFLPDLGPGETITIEYDMKIDSPMTVSPALDRRAYCGGFFMRKVRVFARYSSNIIV